jgi:hypothetical protein
MKIAVVDSHNEVLPFWFEEYLRLKIPLVIVRIDRHHDMNHECPLLPAREGRGFFDYLVKSMPTIAEYAKKNLNEGNFTCPAFHYGIVGVVYHFNPRSKTIDAYGRVSEGRISDSPKTTIAISPIAGKRSRKIIWNPDLTKIRIIGGKSVPVPQNMSLGSLRDDLESSRLPVILGFDLDGLYGMDEKGSAEEIVSMRLELAKELLGCIRSPAMACIARSQTPRAYVPAEMVDQLQRTVLSLMKKIYFPNTSIQNCSFSKRPSSGIIY